MCNKKRDPTLVPVENCHTFCGSINCIMSLKPEIIGLCFACIITVKITLLHGVGVAKTAAALS